MNKHSDLSKDSRLNVELEIFKIIYASKEKQYQIILLTLSQLYNIYEYDNDSDIIIIANIIFRENILNENIL